MKNCNWEEIHGFYSPSEYKIFCLWLMGQVETGQVEEVEVSVFSADVPYGVSERWFACKQSGEVWRLIAPEAPFRGAWEPRSKSNSL